MLNREFMIIYKNKNIKWLVFMVLLSLPVLAQQNPQFTQYMYNTATINPAYAGSRGLLSMTGIYRSQWVGLEGAPKVAQFSLNTPIGVNGVGLGFSVYNEEIGPSIENNIAIDYSYTIPFSDRDTKFSFGLKTGFQLLDVDYNKLLIYNPTEPIFQTNIEDRFQPIIGVGAMLHTDTWYVGLSVPNVLNTEHYDNSTISTASERMHVFVTGGYVFDLNDMWKFKPAFLTSIVSGSPLGVDVSANFWYNQKLTLGAAYRVDAAISALAGFQVTDQLMVGYAYDTDTTDLGRYNNGSHEIFLRWELFTRTRNKISPRFF
ncbi:type IX secretion system membrane protein PorP/SprF [Flavivirga amylovorans]|uniref:Type IX secretion system membrane protein PorP/SprF n=2 Tax=Flavivirga amylovorans TaxID=870486 RepID=A0ABT8WY89_9FLAO|nr:type IX secretion system membrane protein PorP/SprF [Flavivirga amylovorans]MDO5986438.1 type IX secretion system membrane protein PorP/SprF [Flavivirga amylovorans]